jgi:hypothetical protein
MNKPVFAIFLGIILVSSVFAQESFAENAKCARDCVAPTIGSFDDGQKIVDEGLSINDQSFDVTEFSQTIPTQMLVVGQPTTVKLTVYENNGVDALRYVSFAIADYKGERNQIQKARIAFMQNFDGVQKLDVLDFDGLLYDIKYTATKIDSFTTMIKFTFEFAKPVDKSAIIIEVWDDARNARKNILLEAIQVKDLGIKKDEKEKMMEDKVEQEKAPVKVEEKKEEKSEKPKEKWTKKPQMVKGKKKTKLKQQYQ